MVGDLEVADGAERNLADAEGRAMLLDVEQLAVLGDFAAPEHGPAGVLERRFGDERVVARARRPSCGPRRASRPASSPARSRARKARSPTSASGRRPARAARDRRNGPSCPAARASRVGFHDTRTAVESSGPVSMFQRCWSGSRPLKRLTSSLTRSSTMPAGQHAEADVGRIEPMVADRRLGRIHDRLAVHEGRRAERRLARQAGVEEDAALRPDVLRDRRRQLHEQIVRVLAVDQPVGAVGGLAAGEQQRIAALAHQRVGAEHRLELQRAVAERRAAPCPSACPTANALSSPRRPD